MLKKLAKEEKYITSRITKSTLNLTMLKKTQIPNKFSTHSGIRKKKSKKKRGKQKEGGNTVSECLIRNLKPSRVVKIKWQLVQQVRLS